MAKRIVKKKKIKWIPFLIFILIVVSIVLIVKFSLDKPILNINIKNTGYINDDYIIEKANIKNYPSFAYTMCSDIKKKLKKSVYINDLKCKKKFYRVIELDIDENIPVFNDNYNQKMVFSNGDSIDVKDMEFDVNVPRLLNYVPKKKYSSFIKGLSNIKSDILSRISDIEYVPNDIDKDRFLLYMDDDNSIYITLTKFSKLNYYNDVIAQLGNHKGILYLDNGNHFKIKK
ncbi:MAG: FtsQ-type POTRA domain-containing protein [Bacilli bacterium]|nr:FtsQ-type POTRA domain-containing protein [Bacilli bacterium]